MRVLTMTKWWAKWQDDIEEAWSDYQGDKFFSEFCKDAYDEYLASFADTYEEEYDYE